MALFSALLLVGFSKAEQRREAHADITLTPPLLVCSTARTMLNSKNRSWPCTIVTLLYTCVSIVCIVVLFAVLLHNQCAFHLHPHHPHAFPTHGTPILHTGCSAVLYCVDAVFLLQHGAEGKCAHGQREQHPAMVDTPPLLVNFHMFFVPHHSH